MFVGKVCGKAQEAANFYASIFRGNAQVYARYGARNQPSSFTSIDMPMLRHPFLDLSCTTEVFTRKAPWRCLPSGEIVARIECDLRLQRSAEGRLAFEASRQPAEHGHDGDRALPAPHGTTLIKDRSRDDWLRSGHGKRAAVLSARSHTPFRRARYT